MLVYNLTNYLDLDEWHPTITSAMLGVKCWKQQHGWDAIVYVLEHQIGRVTKNRACELLARSGFSECQRQVYPIPDDEI